MAVNWLWKNRLGTMYCENSEGKKYQLSIYAANCVGCYMYEYTDKQTGEKMYDFMGFWGDEKHLERCLGLIKDSSGELYDIYKRQHHLRKIKLNTYFKESWIIAKRFVKAGHKVELYYKEIK